MASERAHTTLAGRIVRTTLLIGGVTLAISAVFSLISASQLASQIIRNRDLRTVQSIEDRIQGHFRTSTAAIAQATTGNHTEDALVARLDAATAADDNPFEQVILADRTARVRASMPEGTSPPRNLRDHPAFLYALTGNSGIISVDDGEGTVEIWTVRNVFQPGGAPLMVLARLDLGFLDDEARASTDRGARSVLIMGGSTVVAQGGPEISPRIETARWTTTGELAGSVRVATIDGVMLQGQYNDIDGIEGTVWRVIALSPLAEQFRDAALSVAPSILVQLIGGFLIVLGAWWLGTRLTRPLRELERSALAAASGAYARRLYTQRDDEIGRVAQAFDAVAIRLNSLQDLSQLLASATKLEQVLDAIISAIGHLVGPGSTATYLLDDAGMLVPVRTQGRELAEVQHARVSEGTWFSKVMESPYPLVLSGDVSEPVPGAAEGPMSAAGMALVSGGEAFGLVVVTRSLNRAFVEAELEMLKTFCAQAAVAIQTSRVFEREIESRRTAEAFRAVAEALVRPKSLQDSLSQVEPVICDLFSAVTTRIALADRHALGLTPSAYPELDAIAIEAARSWPRDTDAPEWERSAAFVAVPGVIEAADRLIEKLEAVEALVVPVALERGHGGVLVVGLARPIPAEWIDTGRALGDEIALALDNAYFYQRAVARAANLETVFKISQAVGSSLQVKVVLNRVLDVVQKILSADAVALMSFDREKRMLTTTMGRGALPAPILTAELQPGEDLPGQVFEQTEPASLRDLGASTGGIARAAAENGLHSLVAVPLLARGRPLGVLIVLAKAQAAFSEEDVNMLQTFASQAALAIDTARLYGQEHEVASVLQASILPQTLPDYDDLEASSVYVPAGGDAEIGGDYYDLFRSKSGCTWLVIADVCGKGVHAATKTSMIRYAVRALTAAGCSPAQVLAEVNDMVADSGDLSDIVTAWVGRLDKDGLLTWADGGHPPGLLKRVYGSIESLDVTGPLLGARKGAPYEELSLQVAPGDLILLYTDGVTEARRGNIFYGEQRVRAVLKRYSTASETASGLLESVRNYAQGELRDDVAVLVVSPRVGQGLQAGRMG